VPRGKRGGSVGGASEELLDPLEEAAEFSKGGARHRCYQDRDALEGGKPCGAEEDVGAGDAAGGLLRKRVTRREVSPREAFSHFLSGSDT